MNLLSNLFNSDDIEITNLNRKYLIIISITIIIMIALLLIKKDNYYQSTFNMIDEKTILLVEKEYINGIKNKKEIVINDIKSDYSIETIEPFNNNYLVSINLKTNIKNIENGTYKINIGKERLFDYIIKKIK